MNPFAPRPVQPLPHYYGLLRPSALHRYSHTQYFSLLCFCLVIKTTGSRSALYAPASAQRHLYAGHHLLSNRAASRLILKSANASSFDVFSRLTTHPQWFRVIRLSDSYLTLCRPFFFTLTTFALNKRRLRRFEACSRKPASRGLPSSSIELMSPPCDATAHLAQNQGLP